MALVASAPRAAARTAGVTAAPAARRPRRAAARVGTRAHAGPVAELAAGGLSPLTLLVTLATTTYLFTTITAANTRKVELEKDLGLPYEDFMALVKYVQLRAGARAQALTRARTCAWARTSAGTREVKWSERVGEAPVKRAHAPSARQGLGKEPRVALLCAWECARTRTCS